MAHEITVREDGFAEFAHSGPKSAIWHSLGQEISEEDLDNFDAWKTRAGMDFEVCRSAAMFTAFNPELGVNENKLYPNVDILFRSDTQAPLSTVSSNYKIVQPGEVIDFFNSLVTHNGFRMSSAGTLFGGRRFWALAETGRTGTPVMDDPIDGHLLLVTSVDGSLSTTARFVTTRVVCNNTLQASLREKSNKPMIKITHHKEFSADDVKIDLGLMDKAWSTFMNDMKTLANRKMSASDTRRFFESVIYDKKKAAHEQGWGATREVDRLVDLALGGSGSDVSKGTAYGALCAATEFYTHGSGKRDASHQFWSGYLGDGENKKQRVLESLLTFA